MKHVIDCSAFDLADLLREHAVKSRKVVNIHKRLSERNLPPETKETLRLDASVIGCECDAIAAIVRAKFKGDREMADSVINAAFDLIERAA